MRPVRIIAAVVLTVAAAAASSSIARSTGHPPAVATPVSSPPAAPTTTPRPPPDPPPSGLGAPTPTLPSGHIQRWDAVQAIGGTAIAFAVGKGTILTTTDGGRTWARVWRGAPELYDVDFVSVSTGWALGDGILLGTVDRGQHWRMLGQPKVGALRQVHFASRTHGWGVAGGTHHADEGSRGHTTLVHTTDGGRTWSALSAPVAPQSVCFTAPDDGWLASDRSVWRSTDGGHSWSAQPSFTLPVSAGAPPFFAAVQCARPGAAWVRFDSDDH
jgi:photosystem II stability/assembly factor-like uncharacterized protein